MLTRSVRIKIAVFAVLAVIMLAFTAVRYANLGRFLGMRGYYVVRVDMADGGGLFQNAAVSYRGVDVGRVGAMTLTANGVQADLNISDSAPPIPARTQAVVADLSAVGEQYIDLRPLADAGPFLTDGSVIRQQDTQLPPPVTNLITSIDALVRSVPDNSLRTVVRELGLAFRGAGPKLQTLLDAAYGFSTAAAVNIKPTTGLIDSSRTVLATQAAESGALHSFSTSLELLAAQFDKSDADLRKLIAAAPPAAAQVTGLLRDNDPSLGIVLANLLTASDLALTRQNALQELLSALPAAVAAGNTVITNNGANFGLALTFFRPLPCTAGYQGTRDRNGTSTSPAPPLNTAARCTEPVARGEVRGSAHAPSGGPPPPPARP